MIVKNQKASKSIDNLLSRQDYLVTQANDLAKAFGNLTTFEHKVLDYCFSYVKKDDKPGQPYTLNVLDVIRQYGLGNSGASYQRVARALKALNEKTAIYMRIKKGKHVGILMTSLFDHISILDDGQTEFSFSDTIAPYVFQLKEHYYSFKLSELTNVKSKYTLSLMKLWNAKSVGKLHTVVISGSLDDWEGWLLGSDTNGKPKHWSAGRFKQKALNVAINELDKLYPKIVIMLTDIRDGRRVVGYKLNISEIPTNVIRP